MAVQDQFSKPRRGRPNAARAGAIDHHIIAVARQMFLSDGYDIVAMEQVAATARISKGTLYARHPSKEALFSAVVEAAIAEWSAASAERDHLLTDDIEQRLRHHVLAIITSLRRPDVVAFQRLVLSVRDRFPETATAMHENGYLYIIDYIARDIESAAERDGVALRRPRLVAELLVAAVTGKEVQDGECGEDLEVFADGVVDLLISARANW